MSLSASSEWFRIPSKAQVESLFNYTLSDDLSSRDRENILEYLEEQRKELESQLSFPSLSEETVSSRCRMLETYILIECLINESGKDISRLENACDELALHTSIDLSLNGSFIENLKSMKNELSQIALEIFGEDGVEEAGEKLFKIDNPLSLDVPVARVELEEVKKRRRVSLTNFSMKRQLFHVESNKRADQSNRLQSKDECLKISPRKKQVNDRTICLCTPRKLFSSNIKL